MTCDYSYNLCHFRCLEEHYPTFPSTQDLTHSLLSSGDLQQLSEGGRLRFLTRFTMELSLLYKGGVLLPDLVKFYQWLHTDLALQFTREDARIAIGEVIKLAEKHGEGYIRKLYEGVKQKINQYVEQKGGISTVQHISDSIPLIHFLTGMCQPPYCVQ